jgi:hypothetical protein
MKLDEKAIEKLIEQVLSEDLPSIKDIELKSQVYDKAKEQVGWEWNPAEVWPKVQSKDITSAGKAYQQKLDAFLKALDLIEIKDSILGRTGNTSARGLLDQLQKGGLAVGEPDKVDEQDLKLRFTGKGAKASLPTGKYNNAIANVVRLEYLASIADNNDNVFKYLVGVYNINPQKHLDIMTTIKGTKWRKFIKNEKDTSIERPAIDQKPTDAQATITEPSFQTQRAERATPSMSEFAIFNNFRGADLNATIRRLTDFSLAVLGPEKVNEEVEQESPSPVDKAQKLLTDVMVMDYLITFAKEIDHGAGAYFFEAFLAFLAGGQAGGKAKGAAGGMGESDFVKKDGKKGSAKYLAKGTDVEQAAKSFLRDDPVEYIVAYKVDSSGKAVSDPDKLYALNISNFFVEKLEEFDENGQANFKISNFKKKEIKTLKVSRNESISMKKYVLQTGIGTLYLAKLDDEDLKPYRENIVAYADTLEDVSQRAFEAFEALSKQLNVAREKSKIYATGLKDKRKQKQTGTDALDAMTAAKDGQEKLINIFENPSPAVTQESKLSDLDKLILEVLKENT